MQGNELSALVRILIRSEKLITELEENQTFLLDRIKEKKLQRHFPEVFGVEPKPAEKKEV